MRKNRKDKNKERRGESKIREKERLRKSTKKG